MSYQGAQQQAPKEMGSPLLSIKNELLHGAVVRGELPTVRRLLDRHRADINTRNSNGLGCLQLAVLNGHTKLAEFLIQRGIDIRMSDPEGYTALHDAAVMENSLLVHKLISKGLSPLLTTAMGELVIDVAGSTQMERQLCEEMCRLGEARLARQYYVYLGLDRAEEPEKPGAHDAGWRAALHGRGHYHTHHHHHHSPRSHPKHQAASFWLPGGAKPSSPKAEAKAVASSRCKEQVSRNTLTHATRLHPSASDSTNAESVENGLRPSPHANGQPGSDHQPGHRELGGLPSNCSLNDLGNHRNVNEEEEAVEVSYKASRPQQEAKNSVSFEADYEDSSNSSCCSSDLSSSDSPPCIKAEKPQARKPAGDLLSHSSGEYPHNKTTGGNPSSQQARESEAIKALQQHSSFQLQIGLSLQSEQFSNLEGIQEEEDPFAEQDQFDTRRPTSLLASPTSLSSPRLATRNSNSSSSSKQKPSLQPDWFLTNQQHSPRITRHSGTATSTPRSRRAPRLLRKTVSFADLPMTRSKPMYVGQSGNTGNGGGSGGSGSPSSPSSGGGGVTTEKRERSRSSTFGQSLSASNILDRYITNYHHHHHLSRGRSEEAVSEETDSMFDAGIRALSLKPRKSSMSMRRHNSESGLQHAPPHRRRSVTFQPEVLLQEIVTDGDVKAVSEILESGVIEDVNKMSPSGLTALHQSAIDGNLECAKTLVRKGADVNCTDCESWTPLHAAVMNGSLEFVRFLLSSGAKPHLKNDAGETPYDMAKNGPIRKMLLNAMNGRSPDADEFSDGEYSGEEEEEEYSHAESESDDELEGDGSGLFDARGEEKTSLKERLGLTHTSALSNANEDSVTPSPDLDNVFSTSGSSSSPAPSSSNTTQTYQRREHELTDSTSSYGSMFESEEQIKVGGRGRGVGSNGEGGGGGSPDKSPVSSGGNGGGKLITESDTDKISESGISTMEGSSDCSHRSRVLSSEDEAITLDSELDPDSLDYEFQEACLYCDVDRVLKLVKSKQEIDINRVNKTSGITALHHSVLEENFALVQHLVKDFGADLHTKDVDGWTPLHAASAVGSIQIAQFLLDRGAKPSSLNLQCEFPVDVAEDEAMEKLLKNAMLGHATEKGLKR